jgi:hypothetical protein
LSEERASPQEVVEPETASKFLDGRFKIMAPTHMSATESRDINIEIGRRNDPVAASLIGPATPSAPINITREIDVALVSTDFDIEQLGHYGTLVVDPQAPALFNCRITPRHQGPDRKFTVNVYGVLRENGAAQGFSLIKVYQQVVKVTVGPFDWIKLAARWAKEKWEPVAAVFSSLIAFWTYGSAGIGLLRKRKVAAAASS